MSRLVPVFWSIVALDTIALIAMGVASLGSQGHEDGGREMGLFFFVIVPAVVLAVTALLFALCRGPVARSVALLVVTLPAWLWIWMRVDDLRIDRAVAARGSGTGFFDGSAMKAMGKAVVDRDIATLRRLGPSVDINAVGEEGMTLLQLAIDRTAGGVPSESDVDEVPVVTTLLALGARPDTGLDTATKRPDTRLLRLLLDAGADPNLRLANGQPLVTSWFPVMSPDALRLLTAHGLDPDTRYQDGPIAVLFTIYRRWDLVDVLVDAGVDVDRPRVDGRNVRAELAAQLADERGKQHEIPDALSQLARRLGVRQVDAKP